MQPAELARALEEVASRLGIEVRFEILEPAAAQRGGGVCRVLGRDVILVDERLATSERVAVLARALSSFDLEAIYVAPLVRATIGAYAPHGTSQRAGTPLPLARTGPRKPPGDD